MIRGTYSLGWGGGGSRSQKPQSLNPHIKGNPKTGIVKEKRASQAVTGAWGCTGRLRIGRSHPRSWERSEKQVEFNTGSQRRSFARVGDRPCWGLSSEA